VTDIDIAELRRRLSVESSERPLIVVKRVWVSASLDRLDAAEKERDELRAKLAVARTWLQRAQMFAPEFARGALARLDGDKGGSER
jgi:hypothetical protein